MHTFSEIAVTVTIWVLTAAGSYFGLRAALRRRFTGSSGAGSPAHRIKSTMKR